MSLRAIFAGLAFGVVSLTWIENLVYYIVGRRHGLEVKTFKFLNIYIRNINNVKTRTNGRFTLLCEMDMAKDDLSKEEDLKVFRETSVFTAAVFLLYNILLWVFFPDRSSALFTFTAAAGIIYILYLIYRTLTAAGVIKNGTPPLTKFRSETVQSLLAGETTLDNVDLPDPENMGIEKYTKSELALYNHIRFMKAVWLDRYDLLEEYIKSYEKALGLNYISNPSPAAAMYIGIYYDLIWYYSYVKPDKKRLFFVNYAAGRDLASDTDSNGRRVLAYEAYFADNNPQLARKYLNEAVSGLPSYSKEGFERQYEEKLLRNLDEIMVRDQTVNMQQ